MRTISKHSAEWGSLFRSPDALLKVTFGQKELFSTTAKYRKLSEPKPAIITSSLRLGRIISLHQTITYHHHVRVGYHDAISNKSIISNVFWVTLVPHLELKLVIQDALSPHEFKEISGFLL